MYFIYYLLFSSTPLAARISSSQPVSSPFFFFSPSNFFFPPPNIFFSFKTFPGQFVLARFLYSYYFKGRTWIPSTSFQGQEDGMRVINNRTVSKGSTISNIRGEICQCRHCRQQCKFFASGVNFSRNNAIYNINESTQYILP